MECASFFRDKVEQIANFKYRVRIIVPPARRVRYLGPQLQESPNLFSHSVA